MKLIIPPAVGAPRIARRNLPLLLLQARESVIANFRPILNAHGLTEQQWRILRVLLDVGPLEPREIVERCRISSPSLAGVLARMDRLGWVRRERWPDDARRIQVSLSDSGRALAQRIAPMIEKTYRDIEAAIGPDLMAGFYAKLDEMIDVLAKMSR
jgi:homoprotocatechuate degradation regulator HpaR